MGNADRELDSSEVIDGEVEVPSFVDPGDSIVVAFHRSLKSPHQYFPCRCLLTITFDHPLPRSEGISIGMPGTPVELARRRRIDFYSLHGSTGSIARSNSSSAVAFDI